MTNLLNGLNTFLGFPNDWIPDLIDDLEVYLFALFAVVAAAGVGYAIFLGYTLAASEDEGKRAQAKSRIMATVGGIMAIVLLTLLFLSPKFRDGLSGNEQRDNAEWRLEIVNAHYCRVCSEWQWTAGAIGAFGLYRRPPDPKRGGFDAGVNRSLEVLFSDTDSIKIQIISWTTNPCPGGTGGVPSAAACPGGANCLGASCPVDNRGVLADNSTKAIMNAPGQPPIEFFPHDHPRAGEYMSGGEVRAQVVGAPITTSGGMDTSGMGPTGTMLQTSGTGVIQISVQFFDSASGSMTRGSFQQAVPLTVIRLVNNYCTFPPNHVKAT